ncbi:hypothetical protein C8R45DRAFT_837640 [Mycena sanguinolenta]|nr:hypothetical protein C8R45DRAFT_837640 [Mycena sanguinolenta]
MNIMTILTAVAGVSTIAWPFCRTVPSMVAISIWVESLPHGSIHRFSSGAWLALVGSAVGQMGSIDDLGRRIGAINTVAGIVIICGPPISGLFADSKLGYIAVGYFAGKIASHASNFPGHGIHRKCHLCWFLFDLRLTLDRSPAFLAQILTSFL